MTRVLIVALLLCSAVSPARAYETETHAGLTERAALASSLHKLLVERLGRARGLYERLTLSNDDPELRHRLGRIDPEGGFVADENGQQSALAWLTAGTALEGVPAHRTRNHFFDPSRGAGLSEEGASLALRTRISDVQNGIGSVRGLFTGASFDGTGVASPAWGAAPRSLNEWGLSRYLDERERAATARTAAERDDALARALLAAGALLHLVEDAGDPALVRNDYRVALESDDGVYERFVATRYGRLAIPEPSGAPVIRAHLAELFRDGQGGGLAERTQRRFFSAGTLPPTHRYALPEAEPGRGARGYVASDEVRHLAAWRRAGDQPGAPPGAQIEWRLDDRAHLDYAEALLPEIGRYAAGALELLFRGRLELIEKAGALRVTDGELALGAGTLSIWAEGSDGERKRLHSHELKAAAAGEELGAADRPMWATRATAVFRGFDAAGEPLVVVQELSLPRP